MRRVLLLLGKDVRTLGRMPALAIALVAYPLVIALVVGLVVRYAGERPRVALVDEQGALSGLLVVGETRFDVEQRLEQATEVNLVRMSRAQAERDLETGRVVAALVVPPDFITKLRGLRESPTLVLRTTRGGLGTRVVEKMRSLVYSTNLELQQAYIDANLAAVDLLLRGGSGTIGRTPFTLLGIQRARAQLRALERSPDPKVAARARELDTFMGQLQGAVGQVGSFLRATANPIELRQEERGGRTWLLSAQVQGYALALAVAFVTVLLGAGALVAEREENVLGRLARGLAGLGQLVVEKVTFVALVGTAMGLVLAVVFGIIVEVGDVSGGEPWLRLPLLLVGARARRGRVRRVRRHDRCARPRGRDRLGRRLPRRPAADAPRARAGGLDRGRRVDRRALPVRARPGRAERGALRRAAGRHASCGRAPGSWASASRTAPPPASRPGGCWADPAARCVGARASTRPACDTEVPTGVTPRPGPTRDLQQREYSPGLHLEKGRPYLMPSHDSPDDTLPAATSRSMRAGPVGAC